MATRLVRIVVDALRVEQLTQFWAAALDWELLPHGHGEGVVRSREEPRMELVVVPTSVAKHQKNRLHFDLAVVSEDDRSALLDRLVFAGAGPLDIGQGDVPWTVLADPEGNEFCLGTPDPSGRRRLAAICLDAADIDAMAAFWKAATGWKVEARGERWVALRHPSGSGPALTMGPEVAAKDSKARVHLDVAPRPDGDVATEVERLVRLGAIHVDIGQGHLPWAVLADPEGNEFCVLTPR